MDTYDDYAVGHKQPESKDEGVESPSQNQTWLAARIDLADTRLEAIERRIVQEQRRHTDTQAILRELRREESRTRRERDEYRLRLQQFSLPFGPEPVGVGGVAVVRFDRRFTSGTYTYAAVRHHGVAGWRWATTGPVSNRSGYTYSWEELSHWIAQGCETIHVLTEVETRTKR